MGSDINPFDSQETKPYKNDPRIAAMTELVDAYQRDDIHRYESILQKNKDLLADPFIAENIDEVTRNMRTKAVVKLVAPYTRFRLSFIAKQLNISIPEVQDIVGFLIMDQKLHGKINQEAGTVEIESRADLDRMHAVADWTSAVRSLAAFVLNDGEGFKGDDGAPSMANPEAYFSPSAHRTNMPAGKRRLQSRVPGWMHLDMTCMHVERQPITALCLASTPQLHSIATNLQRMAYLAIPGTLFGRTIMRLFACACCWHKAVYAPLLPTSLWALLVLPSAIDEILLVNVSLH